MLRHDFCLSAQTHPTLHNTRLFRGTLNSCNMYTRITTKTDARARSSQVLIFAAMMALMVASSSSSTNLVCSKKATCASKTAICSGVALVGGGAAVGCSAQGSGLPSAAPPSPMITAERRPFSRFGPLFVNDPPRFTCVAANRAPFIAANPLLFNVITSVLVGGCGCAETTRKHTPPLEHIPRTGSEGELPVGFVRC